MGLVVACAAIEIATENDPAAGGEHGVFSRKDLSQDASGQTAQYTSNLEDRR